MAANVTLNIGWGYWQMTPNVNFGGGYWDSLAAVQAGWDWSGETALVGLDSGLTNHSVSQFRLTYSEGGLTLAASIENNDNGDLPAIAGLIVFDSGSFVVTASGIWEEDDSTTLGDTGRQLVRRRRRHRQVERHVPPRRCGGHGRRL